MTSHWTVKELFAEALAWLLLMVAAWLVSFGTWMGLKGKAIHERLSARHPA